MGEKYHDGMNADCRDFLDTLERLPAEDGASVTSAMLRTCLPEQAREHATLCARCAEAAEDFAETRELLRSMKKERAEAGPWFAKRVMAAIRAKETEIEEKKEGVWISVRRLAPRLVAVAMLLLVVGGSWAIQLRRADKASGAAVGASESLFEGAMNQPKNDDVFAVAYKEQMP